MHLFAGCCSTLAQRLTSQKQAPTCSCSAALQLRLPLPTCRQQSTSWTATWWPTSASCLTAPGARTAGLWFLSCWHCPVAFRKVGVGWMHAATVQVIMGQQLFAKLSRAGQNTLNRPSPTQPFDTQPLQIYNRYINQLCKLTQSAGHWLLSGVDVGHL